MTTEAHTALEATTGRPPAGVIARTRDAGSRDLSFRQPSLVATTLVVLLLSAFALFLALILTHGFYLGNDSAQSYGHVWFLAHSLLTGHGIPLRMPNLEAGRAFTFPYGALPWVPTALLWALVGDWAVTASLVLGVALLFFGIWRWLPRTASPLLTALMLLNPQLWKGILQFQLPTIWAFAFACLAAAAFAEAKSRRGTLLAAAALIAHPLLGALGLALTTLAHFEAAPRGTLRRLGWLALAGVLAAPAIWMFARTPLLGQVGYASLLTPLLLILRRMSMLWWPWLIQRFLPLALRLQVPALVCGLAFLVWSVAQAHPIQNLLEYSQPRFPDFIAAGVLDSHATYRVLTLTHHEDGMVQLMRAGAVLAQEFFVESIQKRSFGSTEAYRCFLASKRADHVLVSAEWVAHGYTDELRLLDTLVVDGNAALAFSGPSGTRDYVIESPAPSSCPAAGRWAIDVHSTNWRLS